MFSLLALFGSRKFQWSSGRRGRELAEESCAISADGKLGNDGMFHLGESYPDVMAEHAYSSS